MHRRLTVLPIAGLALLGVTLNTGCGDTPCEETLTCEVGETTSTTGGSGGATTSTGSQTTSMGGGGDMGVDTTPPTVVSVTPQSNAVGVNDNATILIAFSEPMDRVATQNAFMSTDLTGVTFAWPDDQTMEVTAPGLSYAEGGHDVVANRYEYTIAAAAADLVGNPMENAVTRSFSTLRSVTDSLTGFEATTSGSGQGTCFVVPVLRVGRSSNTTDCRIAMTFDISPIPQGAQIESSDLTCSYLSLVGPTPTGGRLQRIVYDENDTPTAYNAPVLETFEDPFGFGQPPSTNPSTIDVSSALAAAIASSSSTLQFRMEVDPTPQLQENYLNWRNLAMASGGCKDGFMVRYLAP